MSWFANWFNSPFYHILYKNRDETESKFFIDNLTKKLDIKLNHHVLDLACGKGRHAIYLNSKGYKVTGVDLASESIAHAQQFRNESLDFFVHDMREPLSQKYDIILNLFTSFGYFAEENDNQKAIQSMAQSLNPKGILLIDFLNTQKVIQQLIPYEEKTLDNITFYIRKKITDNFIEKEIRFEHLGQEYEFTERVKALTLIDFEKYFSKSNLKITSLLGNYSCEPYDSINSDRLIIVGEKSSSLQ
jgi:SAM-dependent methyltransferase